MLNSLAYGPNNFFPPPTLHHHSMALSRGKRVQLICFLTSTRAMLKCQCGLGKVEVLARKVRLQRGVEQRGGSVIEDVAPRLTHLACTATIATAEMLRATWNCFMEKHKHGFQEGSRGTDR
jgi:hypothetical protein